jgi:hypothetical protein
MLITQDGSFVPTERTPTRRASVDGIIPIVPLEARSMSEHLAAIVASTPLTVLEPSVDLANNLRHLDDVGYVNPVPIESVTWAVTVAIPRDECRCDPTPGKYVANSSQLST